MPNSSRVARAARPNVASQEWPMRDTALAGRFLIAHCRPWRDEQLSTGARVKNIFLRHVRLRRPRPNFIFVRAG